MILLKLGVDVSRLKPEISKKLNIIDEIYTFFNELCIITSTYEGNHMSSSLHYQNKAIDVSKPEKHTDKILNMLRKRLSLNYDIVLEKDHIHIEYDPKK